MSDAFSVKEAENKEERYLWEVHGPWPDGIYYDFDSSYEADKVCQIANELYEAWKPNGSLSLVTKQRDELVEALKAVPSPSTDYTGGAPGCGACGKVTLSPTDENHYKSCWWLKVEAAMDLIEQRKGGK